MSWFSAGFEEAERMSAPRARRSTRNFWTKPEETGTVRFLSPAKETFNLKRAFIREAKGTKYFTSPMVSPDPFVEAGYDLQATFVWKIIDRRIIEFTDRNGEDQKIGPRVLYFAVGQRDRKALQAFEHQMLQEYNEALAEDGKDLVTIDQYNITSYDIKLSKPPKAAWQFLAVRGGAPKALTSDDKKLLEDGDFSLEEELAPLSTEQIRSVLAGIGHNATGNPAESTEYSYDVEQPAEEPTFFGG